MGGPPVDPYDGAAFEQADLHRLRAHLRYHRGGFEAKPDAWSITETMGNQSRTIRLEREKILRCIDKTLHMIEVALAAGGTIVFYGD